MGLLGYLGGGSSGSDNDDSGHVRARGRGAVACAGRCSRAGGGAAGGHRGGCVDATLPARWARSTFARSQVPLLRARQGLTDSEGGGGGGGGGSGGGVELLRSQIRVQAGEIMELQDRVQDLLEKVRGRGTAAARGQGAAAARGRGTTAARGRGAAEAHSRVARQPPCDVAAGPRRREAAGGASCWGVRSFSRVGLRVARKTLAPRPGGQVHDLREGRREAEGRLAWALERLDVARGLLAERGVAFEVEGVPPGGADEGVGEGGGGNGSGGGGGGAGAEGGGAGAVVAVEDAAGGPGGRSRGAGPLRPADSAQSLGWAEEAAVAGAAAAAAAPSRGGAAGTTAAAGLQRRQQHADGGGERLPAAAEPGESAGAVESGVDGSAVHHHPLGPGSRGRGGGGGGRGRGGGGAGGDDTAVSQARQLSEDAALSPGGGP
jgi:hypothetical protein